MEPVFKQCSRMKMEIASDDGLVFTVRFPREDMQRLVNDEQFRWNELMAHAEKYIASMRDELTAAGLAVTEEGSKGGKDLRLTIEDSSEAKGMRPVLDMIEEAHTRAAQTAGNIEELNRSGQSSRPARVSRGW